MDAVDAVNDRIFVFTGTYTTSFVLLSGEQLIGQGATGTTFDALFGVTPPTGTIARPAINGTRPSIQNTVMLANSGVVRGLNIASSNVTALTDPAGATTGVSVTEADVSATTAAAVSFNDLTGTVTLGNTTSGGGANNVSLTNVGATVSLGTGALSGSTGTAFDVSGGTGVITYGGAITKANIAQRPVSVANKTGGSVTFTGGITANTGPTTLPLGISLTTNTGSTINFQGGLDLSTGANAAFTATGGGTVNVCSENPCAAGTGSIVNRLETTTGTALTVANTTIGANNLEFRSISANGAANGIVLNTTGSGGLTVTGNSSGLCGGQVTPSGTPGVPPTVTAANAADCTGGTIQNITTGDAISLTNAANVSLTRMRILNVSGLNNGGIDADNLGGSNFFRNSQMDNVASSASNGNGIDLTNTTTALTLFSVEDSFFANSLSQTSHILSSAQGNVNAALDVRRSIFQNLISLAVQSNAGEIEGATHTVTTNIVGNVFRNASITNGQGGIAIANAEQNATHNYTVTGNLFEDLIKGIAGGNAEILLSQTVGGNLNGTVSGNILGTSTNGNGDRRAIGVITEPNVTANGELAAADIIIDGNTVDRLPTREGAFIDLREDTQNSEIIVRNNQIGNLAGFQGDVGGIREAVDLQLRGDTAKTLNVAMTNNIIRSNTTGATGAVNLETNNDADGVAIALAKHVTVTGNTITATAGIPHLTARTRTGDTGGTVCLDMSGNTLSTGSGIVLSREGGAVNVEQASSAALSTANSNVTVTQPATAASFATTCLAPPL